ncbi:MAG TPA: hypothetical protein DEH25_03415 [Chloroflexi bacterium]|nr:hypothetical protein [Chloroflexota bacterium]
MKSKYIIIIYFFVGMIFLSACGQGADPLAGTTWDLVSIAGAPLIEGTAITATFDSGQIGGSACNSYSGSYTVNKDTITIGQIASTEMYCVEPAGAMDQESAYFTYLLQAQKFETSAGKLSIITSGGATLVFEPIPTE